MGTVTPIEIGSGMAGGGEWMRTMYDSKLSFSFPNREINPRGIAPVVPDEYGISPDSHILFMFFPLPFERTYYSLPPFGNVVNFSGYIWREGSSPSLRSPDCALYIVPGSTYVNIDGPGDPSMIFSGGGLLLENFDRETFYIIGVTDADSDNTLSVNTQTITDIGGNTFYFFKISSQYHFIHIRIVGYNLYIEDIETGERISTDIFYSMGNPRAEEFEFGFCVFYTGQVVSGGDITVEYGHNFSFEFFRKYNAKVFNLP